MKTKLLYLTVLALVACQPACTTQSTGQPPVSEAARARINAALERLAADTIALGELAAAGQIDKLRVKVIPQK